LAIQNLPLTWSIGREEEEGGNYHYVKCKIPCQSLCDNNQQEETGHALMFHTAIVPNPIDLLYVESQQG